MARGKKKSKKPTENAETSSEQQSTSSSEPPLLPQQSSHSVASVTQNSETSNITLPHQQPPAPVLAPVGPQNVRHQKKPNPQQQPPAAQPLNIPLPYQEPPVVASGSQAPAASGSRAPAVGLGGRAPAVASGSQAPAVSGSRAPAVAQVSQVPTESEYIIPKRIFKSDFYKTGEKIIIETNHVTLLLSSKQKKAFHYNVTIEPDWPKNLLKVIFLKYLEKYFPKIYMAFDGMNHMYSPVLLPIRNNRHRGMVQIFEDDRASAATYAVYIQYVAEIDLSQLLTYLTSGTSKKPPQSALQCLNIIRRHSFYQNFTQILRSFYSPIREVHYLGVQLNLWHRHIQSTTLGWKPYINVDVAHKVFTKEQNIVNLINELDSGRQQCVQRGIIDKKTEMSLKQYITDLKISFQMPNQVASKRVYRVKDVVGSPMDISFLNTHGNKITVYSYFLKEKQYQIQYPNLPCLDVGKDKKVCYPVELCSVLGGQSIILKMDQTKYFVNPPVRKDIIYRMLEKANLNADPVMKAFDLSVGANFERVCARILKPPTLLYKNETVIPNNGVWDPSFFLSAANLKVWCIFYMDQIAPNKIKDFVRELKIAGGKNGMIIQSPKILLVERRSLEEYISKAAKNKMQLLLVIIGINKDYATVKKSAELNHGLLTQCIKKETVEGFNSNTASMLLQKMNSKLNFTNHTLAPCSIPSCLRRPCMIVGADVTHPSPGQNNVPSFAAVTASHDSKACKYSIALKIQPPKVEIIEGLDLMIRNHLKYFYRKTNRKPHHIIMFRDGVSEGEFKLVLNTELLAIRAACQSLESEYKPKISIFIVIKRHHTRFFPISAKHSDMNQNAMAGTCVDSQITHPTELGFYLLSHASKQGTSRPTRYHCIWDDANMIDEDVEYLAYYLCYLYTGCTQAISYPVPTYYAHLAAARAKVLSEGVNIDLNNLKGAQSEIQISEKLMDEHPMFFV